MEKPRKNLEAWKQSTDLVIMIYRTTQGLPTQESCGLTNQIRSAALFQVKSLGAAGRSSRLGYLNDLPRSGVDEAMERIDK